MYVGRTVGIDSKAVFIFIFFVAGFEINPGFSFFEAFFPVSGYRGIKYQSLPAAVRYIVCHSEVGQVRKDGVIPDFDGVVGCQGAAATFHGLHIVYVDFVVIGIYRFPDVTFGLCFLFTPALCCCGLHGKHSRQT